MSEPRDGIDLPPDLPPEHAEAYRRGYERAVHGTEPTRVVEPAASPRSHRAEPADGRRGWLAPAMLVALVLVLLLGAYVVGRAISSSVAGRGAATDEPDGVSIGDSSGAADATDEPDPKPTRTAKPTAEKYAGVTEAADVSGAEASCETAGSVDAAGNQVGYAAANAYDGDLTTAWRCDGDGVGETLVVDLPGSTRIGEVGLVPGYAKTDVRSGVDRYAENNRLTRVRWTFGDGSSVVQELDPSPDDRSMQSVRVPVARTDEVTVEVLGSTGGTRDTVAVSELRIGRVTG